jgi:hypothetical protein
MRIQEAKTSEFWADSLWGDGPDFPALHEPTPPAFPSAGHGSPFAFAALVELLPVMPYIITLPEGLAQGAGAMPRFPGRMQSSISRIIPLTDASLCRIVLVLINRPCGHLLGV